MFNLKRPCVTCPFRKGVGEEFNLPAERLEEIKAAAAFQCHKTVNYNTEETDEEGFSVPDAGNRPEQCAGLMAVLHRENAHNQIMQMAERLRFEDFDPAKLDPKGEAYACWADVLAAHADR